MSAANAFIDTAAGVLHCARQVGTEVHRVGYKPSVWEWTPWEYATGGRFHGRWDDPGGIWRTLYTGATRLACYLEVLAFARPSPAVIADLADIAADEQDDEEFPTLEPGRLPVSWCAPRMAGRAALAGWFAIPGHPESLATLRARFRITAIQLGLDDLDAATIRDGRPRVLTQKVSSWINMLVGPDGSPVAGVEFDSRHGDGLRLWAVYEQPGDPVISPKLLPFDSSDGITRDDPDLQTAMRMLGLIWDTQH